MNNITLIGMPSCGKSTLGRLLAEKLGYAYLDTDDVIREQNGCHLQDILDNGGMEAFNKREEEAICSIHPTHTVIATGGSAVYSPKAMAHLAALGPIVYLSISYETLMKRVGDPRARGVAIAPGMTFRDLYEERVPLYRQYTNITLEEADGETAEQSLARLLTVLDK